METRTWTRAASSTDAENIREVAADVESGRTSRPGRRVAVLLDGIDPDDYAEAVIPYGEGTAEHPRVTEGNVVFHVDNGIRGSGDVNLDDMYRVAKEEAVRQIANMLETAAAKRGNA